MFSFSKKLTKVENNEKEIDRKMPEKINFKEYEVLRTKYLQPIINMKNKNDFYHVVSCGELMIDKSLIINEIINNLTLNKVFLGPSCGKTFNLSMLRYFLEKNKPSLFEGLNISRIKNWRHHYRKYSVIYLDFSNVQANCEHELKVLLHQKMSMLYQEHAYLLENESLSEYDRKYFNAILDISIFPGMKIEYSLKRLAKLITEANHGLSLYERPIIIINHYDDLMSPEYQAEKNKMQWEPGWELLNAFFLNGLKDHPYFKFSIISGTSSMSHILPNNCAYFKADSVFACSFKETLHFLEQYNIIATPDILNKLSMYDSSDCKNIQFSEGWYHPQKIIHFVKDNLMDKEFNSNLKEDKKASYSHLFFNKLNQAHDEEEKLIIAQDIEISKQIKNIGLH